MLKTIFDDITRFIVKMSNSNPIQNSLEDESNLTHESESSSDESLPDFSKLQPYMYEPCISNASMNRTNSGKESSDSEEDNIRIGNTL